MRSKTSLIIVAVAAVLFPAGLRAQIPSRPVDESQPTRSAARIKVETETPRATALRQSIAREIERQAAQPPKKGAPAPNWPAQHKKGLIVALVVAVLVMVAIGVASTSGD